jgi:glycine/D-amino acid oxidase-like deaminating enzyme
VTPTPDGPRSDAEYRTRSLWLDSLTESLSPRPTLGGDIAVDVAIIGAGYTGLWTAYYLLRADPHLRIAVIEREIAGFGASGRNGGWCSALFAGGRDEMARAHGRDSVIALLREMRATVDEVGRVATAEGIDAEFHKGGTLTLATSHAQLARVRASLAEEHRWGASDDDAAWLDRTDARRRVGADGVLGGAYTPHCARVQPAKLARGLAEVVARRGAAIFEQTTAIEILPGEVRTRHGRVRAPVVVRATEGYTARITGLRRVLAPLYSLMIATAPLPSSFWAEVGWEDRDTLTDGRHLIIYAQRTADDRIAIGGRGAPYHYASRTNSRFDRDPRTFAELRRVLVNLFPSLIDSPITHEWGGPLGAPRDWTSSVGYDRATGLAWAGGYVGDGVSTTNLAGRTLADLITGADTPITQLPWVAHRSPQWEPEPLRWLGITLGLALSAGADRAELRTGRPARLRTALLERLTGH